MDKQQLTWLFVIRLEPHMEGRQTRQLNMLKWHFKWMNHTLQICLDNGTKKERSFLLTSTQQGRGMKLLRHEEVSLHAFAWRRRI